MVLFTFTLDLATVNARVIVKYNKKDYSDSKEKVSKEIWCTKTKFYQNPTKHFGVRKIPERWGCYPLPSLFPLDRGHSITTSSQNDLNFNPPSTCRTCSILVLPTRERSNLYNRPLPPHPPPFILHKTVNRVILWFHNNLL